MFIKTVASILLVVATSHLHAASEEKLNPTRMQAATTKDVVKMLMNRHYRDLNFDDNLSNAFLDKYLESLDPARMYFLAGDVAGFDKYRDSFDDDFKSGKLTTGFEIYRIFQKRMKSRLKKVVSILENPQTKFDFTIDESIEIDRENSPWPITMGEADELWRKRIKLSILNQKLSDKEVPKAIDTLTKRYKNQLKRIEQQSNVDVYEALINSLTLLYDPHTNYFSPRTSENFNISMSLSLEGIGAVLQSEDEHTKVVRLVHGGPAFKQGELKPADKIIGVGQGAKGEIVPVVGWRLDEVVDKIRGKKNSIVRLEVISGDEEVLKTISIVRDKVNLEDQAAKKDILEIKSGNKTHKIGVIDIPAFYINFKEARSGNRNYRSTTRDVKKLVMELMEENVTGIVLDLRDNGGGSLQEATQLTDLFINQGPVVQIRQSDGKVSRSNRAYSRALYNGPLVVMINRLSASASEIFAGAIQDYQRGLVVGSQSFGKGTVQLLSRLPEGELKLTESKFYRVSGDSTQHRGVIPDILFPELVDHEEVGESTYDTALPWDQIHPASHRRFFNFKPFISELTEKHKKRSILDPDFKHLLAQIELSNINKDRKYISLKEETRINEKNDLEKKSLALENTRRKSKNLEPYKTFEAFKDAKEKEDEEERNNNSGLSKQIDLENDALLREAGNILVDFSALFGQGNERVADIKKISNSKAKAH